MRSLASIALGAVLVFSAVGCDSTPGVAPTDTATPPRVSNLLVTPGTIQFEDVAGDGQTATFTINASAEVAGEASEVRFVVQPQASFDPVGETVATAPSNGRVEGQVEVTLPRDQAGLLSVLAIAVGADGGTSEARTTVFVERENSPPVIENISGPATFSPPGILRFDVTVSDPDGLNDVLKVQVSTPIGQVFDLFPVRDGFYSAGFDVPDADPGENVFTFTVTDRRGAESSPVDFIVTIG